LAGRAGLRRRARSRHDGAQHDLAVAGPVAQRAPVILPPLSPPRVAASTWLLAVLGIVLIVLANASLVERRIGVVVPLALLAGLTLWGVFGGSLVSSGPLGRPVGRGAPAHGPPSRLQLGFAALAVASGVATVSWSGGNEFRTDGVVAWIVAISAWIVAWWPAPRFVARLHSALRGQRGNPDEPMSPWAAIPAELTRAAESRVTRNRLALVLTLAAILGLGAVFFFHQIDQTPRDPTSDHAEKLLDVQMIRDGTNPIFFERNTGREPAQFYVIYAMVEWLGAPLDFTTMKIGTALVGLLAIPFVYLLASELGGIAAGLAASMLFAVGKWPVEISRAGLRFPYGMTFAAIAVWLLVRWMRTGDRRDAIGCGLAVGIGLYGYSPFRAVVPVVAIGFLILLLAPSGTISRGRAFRHGLLCASTALFVFLPLGRYAIDKPDNFWLRSTSRITGDEDASTWESLRDNLAVFLENNWNAAKSFNYRGDSTVVNAVRLDPFLDFVTGGLLLAGLLTALFLVAQWRDRRVLLALVAIPVLFLPSTLALGFPTENPSVNRAGAAAPVAFALAALPIAVLASAIPRTRRPWALGATGAVLLTVAIGVAAFENFDRFYRDFDAQSRNTVSNTTEIADAIRSASAFGIDPEHAYLIDRAHWLDVRNIGIALDDITWGFRQNIPVGEPLPERRSGEPLLLVLHPDDSERLAEVREAYPDGSLFRIAAEVPAQDFLVYWVPALMGDHAPAGLPGPVVAGSLVGHSASSESPGEPVER
jgi:hypothetical protein